MKASFSTLLIVGLATAFLSACQSTSSGYSAADEALYMERYNDFFEDGSVGLSAYAPLAPVAGASDYKPLDLAEGMSIAPAALAEAQAYAASTNSSSLLIWHVGQLVAEYYFGEHERETHVISRSLAKPIATVAVGRAIFEGYIDSLDQPAADFFPEWSGDDRSNILIRHLLDMRTGLLPQGFATEADDILNRAYLHPRHDEIIINEYPLVDEPGSRYEYANANSELIAPLIERAAGMRYEDWVSTQILQKVGAPGGDVWLNREGGTAHSGCCILLPAETFLRLAVLLLQDGTWDGTRLLPEGYVTEMRTPTPQHPHAGMGVYVAGPYIERRGAMNLDRPFGHNLHSEPYLADDLFLFDGNGHQVGYIVPSADLVILRTGVRPDEGMEWDNAKLPNTLLSGMTFEDGKGPVPQPYAIDDVLTELTAQDGRVIPVRQLSPVGCDETCPLMIFSHGAFSTYDRYDALLLPLVKAGYRIVAPNHVDSEEHPDRDAYEPTDAMAKRLEDYAAITAQYPAEVTIAIGHSFGGLIAQIAGGAILSGPMAELGIDPALRPDGVVAISPPGPIPGQMQAEGWSRVEVPMLVTTGTTDILPGFIDEWQAHLVSYDAALHPETYALIYEEMDHYLNGAYGRETDLDGDALGARQAAVGHLIGSTDLFAKALAMVQMPDAEAWATLSDQSVSATKR
jgi:CubicO group peptidase (beta-lactamase class C family)/pimeloyl-ACP methyl ester carboxylesterase